MPAQARPAPSARTAPGRTDQAPFSPDLRLDADAVTRLQASAGNIAVGRLIEGPPGPADPYRATTALGDLPCRGPRVQRREPPGQAPPVAPRPVVQRDIKGSKDFKFGKLDISFKAVNNQAVQSGESGSVTFLPKAEGPYTTKLGFVQIVKLTDPTGVDVDPQTMPPGRGASLRTKATKGVEGGFFTDVEHAKLANPKITATPRKAFSPYYPFKGIGPQIFGFRRSEDPADIKAAAMTDFPGAKGPASFDFSFETVAKGDDNLLVYGAVKWAFSLKAGKVVNEQGPTFADGASGTWDAALDKHRDFYAHEPVPFYFGFDQDTPLAGEVDKIATFQEYLTRTPDARLTVTGFTDLKGNAAYNLDLGRRRARSMVAELIAAGIDKGRVNPVATKGATTAFSKDAATSQEEDPNRHANRRVEVSFVRPAKGKGKGP